MNNVTIREEQGFQVYTLGNEAIELSVVPGLGARLLSLKDVRTGRQWMDRPLGESLFKNQLGDDFTTSTFAGADECIPTIGACSWKGRELPDHGEVWALAWEVCGEAWANGVLKTSIDLPQSPLSFSRSIRLEGEWLTLDYSVENRGKGPEAFLWALHPLLTLEIGDRLEIPNGVKTLRIECLEGVLNPDLKTSGEWPSPFEGVDLSRLEFNQEACMKFFVGPLKEGYSALANEVTGSRLEFHWSAEENPWLGVWLTRGAFKGFHHVAMEPTNGDGDQLREAVNNGSLTKPLLVGETRSWTLKMRLGVSV